MYKKLLGTFILAFTALSSGANWAQVVGYVHESKGDVTLRDLGKQPAKAAAGDTFQQGAAFTTGADGQVTLKFEDGQLAIIAPNSQFVATSYVFNKAKVADSNILLTLTRGGLRFVSGMIASTNREKFAIRTPTATAGVRGSTGGIALGGDGSIMASTDAGAVTLTVGGVTVVIPVGATSIAPPNGTPSAPTPTATTPVPPALIATANLMRALAAANLPGNAPVNAASVAAAVKAAVALAQNPTDPVLIAAANAANTAAAAANNVVIQQAAAGGGVAAPPPAGGTPAPPAPPVTITTPPPPVPSGS